MKDYVEVIYNEGDRPFTEYPSLLTAYLADRFELGAGMSLLDLGCGRGEFLHGFIRRNLDGHGVDGSMMAKAIYPNAKIVTAELEDAPLPYRDNTFDVVFSKSVLEHFYYPEKIVREIHRVLKPGGLALTMVPDWEAVYKQFYEDYTHRTPFSRTSLHDIFVIQGFEQVQSEKFRQLPILWKWPWLVPVSMAIGAITPIRWCRVNKFIRFSTELMLLSSAVKPKP
jgi:SAM-dependent methyltransferase